MAKLTQKGGQRIWIATDWSDLLTLTGTTTQAMIGDRCWYRDGACWLTRKTITTQESASKTRWIPDLSKQFGCNDRSAYAFGSIDDEGIVTLSASTTTTATDYNCAWDCLGLIFDTSGGAITLYPAANVALSYLHLRAVHVAITGGNKVTISMRGCGTTRGNRGSWSVAGGNAGLSATAYHGQFMVVGQGGGGGGGGYTIS